MKSRHILFLCCMLCLLSLFGCGRRVAPVSRTGFYFDTVITVTLYAAGDFSTAHTSDILNGCVRLCETYESLFSRTREGSDIWKINHADGAPVTVSPETASLLSQALSYCRLTDGRLDITIAPVSSLWNFSSETADSRHVPGKAELAALLPHVNYKNLVIDGSTVLLNDPEAAVDLGCIAKGYIADRLKEYLEKEGVTSAVINLGGNVLTLGSKPGGLPFSIGIQKPFAETGTPVTTLQIHDSSLVSSGVYERYFQKDGAIYHHILDARTGMPVRNGLLSVTVLSRTSTQGDALSTACFLMGLEDGMAYIESLPDTEAVFLTSDNTLHTTSGITLSR